MKGAHHSSTRRSISSRSKGKPRKDTRPRIEVSAGGIVFKRTRRGVFFAMLKDSFGKWTFPKGHVRRGETHEQAAAREIREEMGLTALRRKKALGHIDIWFKDRYVYKGKLIHKYIHYFLFEAHPRARLTEPEAQEKGERIQAVAWIPMKEVEVRSNYKDMQPILERAFAILSKKSYHR